MHGLRACGHDLPSGKRTVDPIEPPRVQRVGDATYRRRGERHGAADHALARLRDLALRFEDEAVPYRALILPMWKNRYGTYDDLARVKEWSETGGAEGSDE